jgi:hypothetical protein
MLYMPTEPPQWLHVTMEHLLHMAAVEHQQRSIGTSAQ